MAAGAASSKYYLATFGCQMNVYDSNLIASMLERNGLSESKRVSEAQVVIVNTCSVRGGAEDRAYARIAAMRHFKKNNPDLKIAVVGCMAQNHKEKIPMTLEHVDFVVGPDHYSELENLLFPQATPREVLTGGRVSSHSPVLSNKALPTNSAQSNPVPSLKNPSSQSHPQENTDTDLVYTSHQTLPTPPNTPAQKAPGTQQQKSTSEPLFYQLDQDLLDHSPYANSSTSKKRKAIPVLTTPNDTENYIGQKARLDSSYSAFVAIMRGCNKKCSYCIVPFVRGKERSRPYLEILQEVQEAVNLGIPEVTLLGQTVNSYRIPHQINFAGLLQNLQQVEGLARIRYTSPHPRHFTPGVIDIMAGLSKVCPHIHLPLQSGSDKILKSMRRQYTRAQYLSIINNLRQAIPGIAITTDIITGYPGESLDDFQSTLSLVEEIQFDAAFMFSYSPREGTEACNFKETLTAEEKAHRLQTLINLQQPITFAKTDFWVGKTVEVLLEGPSERNPDEWMGKTPHFKKVILPYTENLRPGQIVTVLLNKCKGLTLFGVPL